MFESLKIPFVSYTYRQTAYRPTCKHCGGFTKVLHSLWRERWTHQYKYIWTMAFNMGRECIIIIDPDINLNWDNFKTLAFKKPFQCRCRYQTRDTCLPFMALDSRKFHYQSLPGWWLGWPWIVNTPIHVCMYVCWVWALATLKYQGLMDWRDIIAISCLTDGPIQ